MPKRSAHGRFSWHELSTSNPAAAATFYAKVTPWTTQPWAFDESYTLFSNDGSPLGGVTTLDESLKSRGVPPHWLAYVSVYDVDACARQVPKLGGQVRMGPKEIPNVG